MNESLELIKNLLVCACLAVVLATSCRNEKTADGLLSKVNQLQAVAAPAACPCNCDACQCDSGACKDGACPLNDSAEFQGEPAVKTDEER